MDDIAALLRQDAVAARLRHHLDEPDGRVVRLTGPAGSGKSHIARSVAATWSEQGGRCVVAVGDDQRAQRDLYPLLWGLSRTHPGWAGLASDRARSSAQAADVALAGAPVSTTVFDLLSGAFRQRVDRLLKPYSAPERDVILDLRRLARSHRVLVVADNGHWFDGDSLRLLRDLISDDLREEIKQLASVRVLLVDTAEEQEVVAAAAFEPLAGLAAGRTERLDRCGPRQYGSILRALGLTEQLPDDVLIGLHAASGGHLRLAEEIVAYARHGSLRALTGADAPEWVSTLVTTRVASIGSQGAEVADLLARAAVLGLAFTEDDLRCISPGARATLRDLVRRAEQIGFIARDERHIAFSHDVIRTAILGEQTTVQLHALYAKLAECLSILRPGEYAARAQAHVRADETEAARDMYALACVSRLRNGTTSERVLIGAAADAPSDEELLRYLRVVAAGYEGVAAGEFAEPLPSLLTPVAGESPLMAAERSYVASLCSLELQTADGFEAARTILTTWIPSLGGEAELGRRFLMLLQQAQVLEEDFDAARETQQCIEQQLLPRARTDVDAAVALQIQNRRAGALNSPAVAEQSIGEAVEFFRRGTGDPMRDQLELFRSLNNLAATQLRIGRFAEAHAHATEAEGIAVEVPHLVKRLDCLASNSVLAASRLGAIDAAEAVKRQQVIIDSPEGGNDKFLHRCNLVAFLLLAGSDAEAGDELRRLDDELRRLDVAETYLHFYCAALSVGLAAVRGDTDLALRLHDEMEEFANSVRWPTAPHVRRRHLLLRDLLPAISTEMARRQADRILLDAHPDEVGPGWDYYARLFPCAELSYWSDS